MKTTKMSKLEREVAKWSEEVRILKQKADTKRQEIMTLESELEQFEAQYDTYVQTLQGQRQDLAERVQRYRFLIQHGGEPEPSQQFQEAQPLPPPPEPEPPPKESAETLSPIESIRPLDNLSDQKTKARNFFINLWHPDKQRSGARLDLGLAHQVLAAFKESKDLVDFLIAIPWHSDWLKQGENEPIEMQLGRLINWQEALEQADERLDQALTELQQHEFYPLLSEKRTAEERGEDYFAQLATRERDEISRLEQTLNVLQGELRGHEAKDKANG